MKFTLATAGVVAFSAYIQSAAAQAACADQAVFDLCKQNQDKYIATCGPTAKLSCYASCPNDVEKGTQENIVSADCSVPGANVTSTWSNTALPTSTSASAVPSASANASTSAAPKPSSAGNDLSSKMVGSMIGSAALAAAAYLLL
ncbi:hypothetical protein [Absidia glauca]|uniref:Extracellular membrane protein CFEM domain-containing protein n=1 Tax=Absidia glauca TaxID=4829 RepID=A0A168PPA7_ABSGL|nr:hypothetical protein [Absidia glauca]